MPPAIRHDIDEESKIEALLKKKGIKVMARYLKKVDDIDDKVDTLNDTVGGLIDAVDDHIKIHHKFKRPNSIKGKILEYRHDIAMGVVSVILGILAYLQAVKLGV